MNIWISTRLKRKKSVFHKHIGEKHRGERQEVELKVVSSCGNDAMLRQVTEAIFIKKLNPELNTKDESGNLNALSAEHLPNLLNLFEEGIRRTSKLKNSFLSVYVC